MHTCGGAWGRIMAWQLQPQASMAIIFYVYPPKKSEARSNFGGAAVGGACGDRQPPESWASTRHVRCVGRAATRRQMNEASIRAWHAIQLYICNHSQTTLSVNYGTAVSPHSLQISIWHCHGALRSCHLRAAQAVAVAMHIGHAYWRRTWRH